jgi:restriction endonuclease S subunit
MKLTLKDLATVSAGQFFRPVNNGTLRYILAKNIGDNGEFIYSSTPTLLNDDQTSKHILTPGDIVFISKGTKNIATLITSTLQPSVASSSLFVIRMMQTNLHKILPEYLVWYLNSERAQAFFKSQQRGSDLQYISKGTLQALEISLPNTKQQHAIVHIAKLRIEEKRIFERIQKLKESKLQQQISNALN